MDIAKFFRNVFLFSAFESKELERISGFSRVLELKAGETLFAEGEKAKAFFVIVSGKIKISKISKGGLEQILHIHKPSQSSSLIFIIFLFIFTPSKRILVLVTDK